MIVSELRILQIYSCNTENIVAIQNTFKELNIVNCTYCANYISLLTCFPDLVPNLCTTKDLE